VANAAGCVWAQGQRDGEAPDQKPRVPEKRVPGQRPRVRMRAAMNHRGLNEKPGGSQDDAVADQDHRLELGKAPLHSVEIRYGVTDVLVPAAHGTWLAAHVPRTMPSVSPSTIGRPGRRIRARTASHAPKISRRIGYAIPGCHRRAVAVASRARLRGAAVADAWRRSVFCREFPRFARGRAPALRRRKWGLLAEQIDRRGASSPATGSPRASLPPPARSTTRRAAHGPGTREVGCS
jgi:hypothetical protein